MNTELLGGAFLALLNGPRMADRAQSGRDGEAGKNQQKTGGQMSYKSAILKPFYDAAKPSDAASMQEYLEWHLADVAATLGYRDGKAGVDIPPAEWSDDSDALQCRLRAAWIKGCNSGMKVRQEKLKEKS